MSSGQQSVLAAWKCTSGGVVRLACWGLRSRETFGKAPNGYKKHQRKRSWRACHWHFRTLCGATSRQSSSFTEERHRMSELSLGFHQHIRPNIKTSVTLQLTPSAVSPLRQELSESTCARHGCTATSMKPRPEPPRATQRVLSVSFLE